MKTPQTPRRTARRLRWLVAIGLLVATASYLGLGFLKSAMPARMVSLIGTTWQIESIGSDRLGEGEFALKFARGDGAQFGDAGDFLAYLGSPCGQRTFGWDLDTDGSEIGFWLLGDDLDACAQSDAAIERRIVEALPQTTHWVVQSNDVVDIKGGTVLRLERVETDAPTVREGRIAPAHSWAVDHVTLSVAD